MPAVDEQVKKLNELRSKTEELSREKSRLTGELDSHKKRLAELEKKCKAEFDCTIEELPNVAAGLESQAAEFIAEAEAILGLRESGDEQGAQAKGGL